MSTITLPARVLSTIMTNITPYTDSPYPRDLTYIVTLQSILPQIYLNTTQSSYAQYNGNDIRVGDWVSSGPYGRAYQIFNISSSSTTTVQCIIIDVNGYILSTFGNNFPIGGMSYIFQLNEDGFPILSSPLTVDAQDVIAKSWQVDLISHFMSRNIRTQYVSMQQSGHGFSVGVPIYIDSSSFYHQSAGDPTNIQKTVGIVTQVGVPDSSWFTFRPLGHYFDNSYLNQTIVPSGFTGGNLVYINPTGPGPVFVSTKPSSVIFPVWQMITSTSAILLSGAGGAAIGYTGPQGPSFTSLVTG